MSATAWAPSAATALAEGAHYILPPGLRRVEDVFALAQAGRGLRAGCDHWSRDEQQCSRTSAALFIASSLRVS